MSNPVPERTTYPVPERTKLYGPEGKDNSALCPILCVADVTDYWSLPSSPILLDTSTMKLYHGRSSIQLPKDDDGSDPITQGIWNKYVSPHLSFDKDLRFLDRSMNLELQGNIVKGIP